MVHINLKLKILEFCILLLFLACGIVQFFVSLGNFVLALVKAIF